MTDYEKFLLEFNLVDEEVLKISRNMSDHIAFPKNYWVHMAPSSIHGNGIFTKINRKAWTMICPARIGSRRTLAGRGMNHQDVPNTVSIDFEGDIYVIAQRDITAGEELTSDYRLNMRLR